MLLLSLLFRIKVDDDDDDEDAAAVAFLLPLPFLLLFKALLVVVGMLLLMMLLLVVVVILYQNSLFVCVYRVSLFSRCFFPRVSLFSSSFQRETIIFTTKMAIIREDDVNDDENNENNESSAEGSANKIADELETIAMEQKQSKQAELLRELEEELLKRENVSQTHSLEEEEQSKQFRIQMAKLAAQGNMGLSKDKGGEMSALSPEECGGTTEKYSWTQTETEISIHIPLESFEVKGKECKIEIKRKTLDAKIRDAIVFSEGTKNNRLFADVNVDESTWEIDSDEKLKTKTLTVTLAKAKRTMANKHWSYVCENEPKIDVEKFGPPVVGVNERNPMDMELMGQMFEQMKTSSEAA